MVGRGAESPVTPPLCECPPGVPPVAVVPEPGTLVLVGVGLAVLAWLAWRRRRIAPGLLALLLILPRPALAGNPCECPTPPVEPEAPALDRDRDGAPWWWLLPAGLLGALPYLGAPGANPTTPPGAPMLGGGTVAPAAPPTPALPPRGVAPRSSLLDGSDAILRGFVAGGEPAPPLGTMPPGLAAPAPHGLVGLVPPRTATRLPLYALLGAGMLAAGLAILRRRPTRARP